MANVYTRNPIVLDTFSSAIDVRTQMGFPVGSQLKLHSIEWNAPTNANHTAVIYTAGTDSTGTKIFDEVCITANQSIVKYFNGRYVDNLYIAASGVASGEIYIELA